MDFVVLYSVRVNLYITNIGKVEMDCDFLTKMERGNETNVYVKSFFMISVIETFEMIINNTKWVGAQSRLQAPKAAITIEVGKKGRIDRFFACSADV